MALTTNQLVVGMFNMAAGGYKTLVSDYVTAHGNVAAADALLPLTSLNPMFLGAYPSNANFATNLVAYLMSSANSSVQTSVASIIADYMTANPSLSRGAVTVAVIEALLAVSPSDTALGSSVTAFTNKVTLADAYTGTSTDFATLAGAVGVDSGTSGGQTFALTQGLDSKTGGSGNDIFNALLDGGSATFQETDIINGGDGTDTLTVLGLGSGGAVSFANVSNMEKFYLQSTADTLTVDFSKTGAETHVYNYNSTGAATFSNISSASVELGSIGGTAGKTNTFAFASTNTGTAATLVVNGAVGTTAITDHTAVKTVTVKSEGSASTMGGLTLGSSVTKLVLQGDKKLDISATNLGTTIVEIDASASTGGVVVQQAQAINQKFTGGAGNDTFKMGAAGTNLAKEDVLNGGDGTDTLEITTAIGSTAVAANVTNFEVLAINGAITQDMDNFPVSTINLVGANAVTLNNVANNATVNVNATGATPTINLKTNGAADALTVNIGNTAGGYTVASLNPDVRYELITVNSQGSAANTITVIGTAVNNVAFTGATGLTLTEVTNVTGVLDFSKMTAGVTVGSDAATGVGSVANQTVTTTDLVDTIHIRNAGGGGVSGVVVNAGAGNDTATIYAEARLTGAVIDLGAGNDTITYETNALVSSVTIADGAGVDNITIADQADTSNVVLRMAATDSSDGAFVTGLETLGAGVGTDISYKGGLVNGTGTTSAAASVAVDASSATTIATDLATVLAANANATVFIAQRNLTGDVSTALTSAATWVDAATFATRADALETALASAIGTVTGLDTALGTSDKVLMGFDNGTHSVLVYVTNTDTSVANTLTAAEIEVVGVFASTAALAAQDFVA